MVCLFDFSCRGRSIRRATSVALAVVSSAILSAATAYGAVPIVTTTPNLADIVKQIGGDLVSVETVMRGPEDVHNVSPTPSHMVKLKKAKLFVHSGLDTELWAPLLIKGARNPKLMPGRPGNVDASRGITLKEVPGRGELTRALGDIHAFGNVHYALDPLNGIFMARTITDALQYADPPNRDTYESRYESYADRLRNVAVELVKKLEPYRGTPVVTYHRAWPYFLARFGLESIGEVEPKPGIAPGPTHLQEGIERMQARDARVVIVETYSNRTNAEFIASKVNGKAVVLALEVHGVPGADTYENLFRVNVQRLLEAFEEIGLPNGSAQPPPGSESP